MKIKMTSISVNNPIEAHKFYTEVLGFNSFMLVEEANLAIVVSPEDTSGTALLLEPNDAEFVKTFQKVVYKKGLPSIVLGSTDVEKDYNSLKAKGVSFKQEPIQTEWGVLAIFDDTCGNYIQIHQD